ncbi:hypothetical protein C3L33_02944, partial [Rhododendron williamsianum]
MMNCLCICSYQDLQKGLDLGVVSPEVLQNFFDLEQYPLISELTHRFQGFRERLLADPKFLHRLAIEEAISITTTLLAQYERRKENFFEEIDYVITDTLEALKGLLGSIPDNAFQKNIAGKDWNVSHRVASVLFGGLKLASVGFISSIGAVAASNFLYTVRKLLNPALATAQQTKRSPMLKTAVVYSCFLGTSANLRYQVTKGRVKQAVIDLLLVPAGIGLLSYLILGNSLVLRSEWILWQVIAGVVEHRISDLFASQTLLVNMLSFVVRTVNSYGEPSPTQWVDLARYTGLQARKSKTSLYQAPDPPNHAALECTTSDEASIDEIKNQ